VVEETTQDLDVPPEPMREEEQDHSEGEEDRASLEEHESEEEQPNGVLFTSEQLEFLLKMNRPDFNELVEALKGGSSKSVGFKPAVMLWTMQLVYYSQYHVSHTQLQNTYDHFPVVAFYHLLLQ
jgi:hypothetical protein